MANFSLRFLSPGAWPLAGHGFSKAAAQASIGYNSLVRLFREEAMEGRIWLIVAAVMLLAGCAPGYYEKPAPPEPEVTNWTRNPETEAEYERRIQREEWESRFPRGGWRR
jgi:hypothetical protein